MMEGRIPVICVDQSLSSIAFRWRSQLSENSKATAFSWTLPEFNHNEIVGWMESPREEILPLMIATNVQLPDMNDIVESTNITLENHGVPFCQVRIGGHDRTECAMKALMLGDYVSYYLAKLRGVDPIEVKPIVSLKKEMRALAETNEGLRIIRT